MPDYKTPQEIKSRNPGLAWTAQQIGWLLRMKLVKGKKLKRGSLVSEDDVIRLSGSIVKD